MNIVVLVKQVPDTETNIRLNASKTAIETEGIKWVMNPYDEFAVEEAIRIKEKQKTGTITAISLGPKRVVETLRVALAMGVDEAIHINSEQVFLESHITAKAISVILKNLKPDLIISGKQAVDMDQSATFSFVAEYMDIASVSYIVKIEILNNQLIKVEQEAEGGARNVIEIELPAVVAVQKGINIPRYASLPGIMRAKKKEIKEYKLEEILVDNNEPTIKIGEFSLPPERKACKKITGDIPFQVKELIKFLKEESKILGEKS